MKLFGIVFECFDCGNQESAMIESEYDDVDVADLNKTLINLNQVSGGCEECHSTNTAYTVIDLDQTIGG